LTRLSARLEVKLATHWQPGDAFFALLRDRETIATMFTEVIGARAAASHLTETNTQKKAMIRKALTGNGRTQAVAWTPRMIALPQAGDTTGPLTAARWASA
jgi:hypothetical protein